MKLAFCLFNYFPYGGLQRDFLRIAKECVNRGHHVHVFTMAWEGEKEPGLHLHLIKTKGWQNHVRARRFAHAVNIAINASHFDAVIGFNKMPYLDFYYAADGCYLSRMCTLKRRAFYFLLPRFHQWHRFEKAVFAKGQKAHVLSLSHSQQQEYLCQYGTEPTRFHVLPPGIDKNHVLQDANNALRTRFRALHQVSPAQIILLMVGSGFKTKGLDRAIRALASLQGPLEHCCQLWVVGKGAKAPFLRLAKRLKVEERVHFFGGRLDVAMFLCAADLLLHPAYHENTGTVLLEAIASGLPVLTTDICGYAHFVEEANAGKVLSSPFQQTDFDHALANCVLAVERRRIWQQNGKKFGKKADIYSMPAKVADLIETLRPNT